ncbi:MAG: VWA domain-containing protein, partial [Rubripirellula sp.]|nr:VWA domain-containing protein [Rubripirellula sp.]
MGLRHVARTVGRTVATLAATGLVITTLGTASASDGANVRIATYQTPNGNGYFAASIQPSADDALLQAARSQPADVVVVVDTSASQSGSYRTDSIAAMRTVIDSLRSNDRVRIYAADVRASDLSKAFVSADETDDAVAQLKRRLPLGHTNMLTAIETVRSALVATPQNHTRSIVYIGDAAAIDAIGNEKQLGILMDALRADRISVHSVAIGPSMNIELMAVLANQTGGVLGVVGGSANDANSIANRIASSVKMSPIWLSSAKLLDGMKTIQAERLPPLRLDRDSILLGTVSSAESAGQLEFSGE